MKDDSVYLRHILDAIGKIESYVAEGWRRRAALWHVCDLPTYAAHTCRQKLSALLVIQRQAMIALAGVEI